MPAPDRLQELRGQDVLTGLDFVYVHEDQRTLDVYFLRPPETLTNPLINPVTLNTDIEADQVRIYSPSGGESLPEVPVHKVAGHKEGDLYVLRLTTAMPGDFSLYRLWLDDPRIDPYFAYAAPMTEHAVRGHNDILFSFKANCESDLDCKLQEHECPPEKEVDFAVDYRARDFWSFRRALLDFASQRYPDWKDRLEADVGVMLVEVMSALADEMAYYQDRIAREAYLETATQRRSLRRHARLVDYVVQNGLAASTWLDVTASQDGIVQSGADVWAVSDRGKRSVFEVGRGLDDILAKTPYPLLVARNSLKPHIWDEDDTCLPVGATQVWIQGHHDADLPRDQVPFQDESGEKLLGRWVLLQTSPESADAPLRRWPVRLIKAENEKDPVFQVNITHLVWEQEQALPFEMDLSVMEVRGNLVPVTAGRTETSVFAIGQASAASGQPQAVERYGPNGITAYLYSLPGSESEALVWVGDKPDQASPEIHLIEVEPSGTGWLEQPPPWQYRPSLLDSHASERHFALDDGVWGRVVGFQREQGEIEHRDYASATGSTIRFGDGVFGLPPARGTFFRVTYRLDNGRRNNLPAGSITGFDATALPTVSAVTNPLPSTNGLDPEPADQVRQLAPQAFRAVTYRAVRPEDYAEAAQRLSWVQRAGATFRWTGSWLSAFVTPDPRGAAFITDTQRQELEDQVDRFRQAGREAHARDPRYANLDLEIAICVEPYAFRGETKEAVLDALLGTKGARPRKGFFAADNFTFGTALSRSALEATIQSVPGVRAVKGIKIHRRGWFDWRVFSEYEYKVRVDEVIRLENDPLHPERGSLKLHMEGGA